MRAAGGDVSGESEGRPVKRSKTTMTEVHRLSERALDWLSRNGSFVLAIEGIASGDLYFTLKLKPRKDTGKKKPALLPARKSRKEAKPR